MGRENFLVWAEIDSEAACGNIMRIRKRIGSGVKILAPVKADAYGHGAVSLARCFVRAGADFLGTANCDEGIKLREAGINAPVLVFNPPAPFEIAPMAEFSLSPVIDGIQTAEKFSSAGGARGVPVRVHAEIDTGMGRSGFPANQAREAVKKLAAMENIIVEGIFTHFPRAEEPGGEEFTKRQIRSFSEILSGLESDGIRVPLRHASNSAGVMCFPEGGFNMVRPGLLLYGISPFAGVKPFTVRVMSLKTRITHLRKLPAGVPLGYGSTCHTRGESVIATLPAGYADGYDRRLSNKAEVLIKGARFRIAGRISMDRCLVDITGSGAGVGEEAVLIGAQGADEITVQELAEKACMIPHEFVSRLGGRIRKVYL